MPSSTIFYAVFFGVYMAFSVLLRSFIRKWLLHPELQYIIGLYKTFMIKVYLTKIYR